MSAKSYRSTRTTMFVSALFAISFHFLSPVHAKGPADSQHKFEAGAEEPALLKIIITAHWRIAKARAALPPVQVVHDEWSEIQDFIEYAFDGGALRLYVSPGPKGSDIFALLVDTREPRYENFVRLTSTERYLTDERGAYVLVVPLRPVSQKLFDTLKARRWTERELQQELGAPSYNWASHGTGCSGVTYVPEGLSFIGESLRSKSPVVYQVFTPDDPPDECLPAIESGSRLDYAMLQQSSRKAVTERLLEQRAEINGALANGKRSPDGRFVVAEVNFGGMRWTEELVIQELRMPERRYRINSIIDGYLWLNDRTILFTARSIDTQDFFTTDAVTGANEYVTSTTDVADFGVSGPHRFWYKNPDGKRHEVTVHRSKPKTTQ